ncbi:hypothetical protein ACFYW6_31650 [Streptomyces sp. NPDC002659]|uniref:hypothetical protein n=1 Tax=Streptomyces sp. NPDC002659 TaxID=3364656 RepID=UPI0036A24321
MTDGDNSLEAAAQALAAAQDALHVARRNLSAAVVTAYRAGVSVARIAERTGKDIVDIRNALAATGASRRT